MSLNYSNQFKLGENNNYKSLFLLLWKMSPKQNKLKNILMIIFFRFKNLSKNIMIASSSAHWIRYFFYKCILLVCTEE